MPEFDADAVCISGKGNFVLEDCGGADNFMDICDIIVNKRRGHKGILKEIYARYGVKDYDPTKFDVKYVNGLLKKVNCSNYFM